MNTKKKILSFALACLMIVMTFSATIPAFAEVKATDVCKIGDTGYATLYDAILNSESGDTITILKDCSYDKEYNTTGQYNMMLDTAYGVAANDVLTIESEQGETYKVTMVNGGIVSTVACTVTFNNIDFVQDNTGVEGNTQAIVSPRKASTFTFNNCSFSFDGYRGDGTSSVLDAYFNTLNSGGTLNMNNCDIYCNEVDSASPIFGAYASSVWFNVNLNSVNVKVKNANTPVFLLHHYANGTPVKKMTANIFGDTNFIYVDNTGAESEHTNIFAGTGHSSRKGGTVNIFNGRTYGIYAAPALEDGASIRISEQGLRFTIADVSNLGATYGMLFAKDSDTWNNTTFVLDAEKTVSASADGTGLNDTSYNMVLTGATLNQKYAARAYAQYSGFNGATITVYSAFDATKNVRSMSNIANYIVTNNTESAEVIATLKTTYGIN